MQEGGSLGAGGCSLGAGGCSLCLISGLQVLDSVVILPAEGLTAVTVGVASAEYSKLQLPSQLDGIPFTITSTYNSKFV